MLGRYGLRVEQNALISINTPCLLILDKLASLVLIGVKDVVAVWTLLNSKASEDCRLR